MSIFFEISGVVQSHRQTSGLSRNVRLSRTEDNLVRPKTLRPGAIESDPPSLLPGGFRVEKSDMNIRSMARQPTEQFARGPRSQLRGAHLRLRAPGALVSCRATRPAPVDPWIFLR